jgi:uncharacterized protein
MGAIHVHRWKSVVRVALFMMSCAVVLATVGPLMPGVTGQWSQAAVGVASALGAFLLTALFSRWDQIKLKDVGAAIERRSVFRSGIGFLIGLILVGVHSSIVGFAGHCRLVRTTEVDLGSTGVSLFTYIILSCREELAFHGYPLRRLDSFVGLYIAQIVVAIMFALEHVIGGVGWTNAFLGAAVGSLLFGMASLATRGLAVPIGLHAAWNFGSWALGGKETPGLWYVLVEQGALSAERIFSVFFWMENTT